MGCPKSHTMKLKGLKLNISLVWDRNFNLSCPVATLNSCHSKMPLVSQSFFILVALYPTVCIRSIMLFPTVQCIYCLTLFSKTINNMTKLNRQIMCTSLMLLYQISQPFSACYSTVPLFTKFLQIC